MNIKDVQMGLETTQLECKAVLPTLMLKLQPPEVLPLLNG